MTPEPRLAQWITKDQAAELAGCHARTIQRAGELAKITTKLEDQPQPGRKRQRLYNRGDVEREYAQPISGTIEHETTALTIANDLEPPTRTEPIAAIAAAMTAIATMTKETKGEHAKRFLTVKEAARESGLSAAFLKRAIAQGSLQAIKDRAWKIRREDLDKL